ncbi:phage major capsid protein [Cytobacillus firmus]|uniref:phage major capsid protein n=1 Tax=Cytobacillus firmus TaxID=1399 RepID=UPI0018CED829|nr:phage major capsid protein [Cytobacillus firmus]MBG9657090.1 capsid protein [Cytobacillus firmus]MED1906762.1 phage major capsid protein [Cytobacillus firmus]
MNKKLRDLLTKMDEKKTEARNLLDNNKVEEAKALTEEIKALKKQYEVEMELLEEEKQYVIENKVQPKAKNDEKTKFFNAVRSKFKNAMSEGSGADGGYTVPQDILTRINELRESKGALQNLITVEPVSTLSGSRTFKARSQQTGFAEVGENGEILEKATPQFTELKYEVKKYAGFFKVTNELLKDSDQAIEDTLVKWIGDESRVTRNKLILAEMNKKAKTAIANGDDIKDVLNVQLDPDFRHTAIVLTNQDGFNFLDKLKDENGNYLLQPSATASTGKQIFGVDIEVQSNKDLPSDVSVPEAPKAPIIIGDLKEGIVMFDREQTDIAASTEAGNAFVTDNTLFRAIEREEVKSRDVEAFIYGQVTLA